MTLMRLSSLFPALLLALLGLAVAFIGRGYEVGSLTAMGPGFMPVALGVLLFVIALALGTAALRENNEQPQLPWRPLLCAGGSIVLWALIADMTGFFPAAMAQLLLANLALPHHNWRLLILKCVLLAIGAWLLFVILLGLPLPAFGG